jgi:oligo-1,6-glucosidase
VNEFLQEMHRAVFADRPAGLLNVGETPATTVEQARLYTDASRREVDMVFQFEHVDLDSGPAGKWDVVPMTPRDLKDSLTRWQEGLADVGWNSLYLGNHDQPRCVSRFGDDSAAHRVRSAKALATVLHLHRGTPYIYQGDELGMANAPFRDIHDTRDIESHNAYRAAVARGVDPEEAMAAIRYKGRDNARTPMQWDATEHAGFTTGRPWLEVNPDHVVVNAAAQVDDPDSVFSHHQRLVALRHDEPVVAHGDFTILLREHEQVHAFLRRLDGCELLVVANMSSDDGVVADLPDAAEWAASELVLTNAGTPREQDRIVLGPWEARVHRRG